MSDTTNFLIEVARKDWPTVRAIQDRLTLPQGEQLARKYDGMPAEIHMGPSGDAVLPVELYSSTAELYRNVIDLDDKPLNPDGSQVVVTAIPNGVLYSGDEQVIHAAFDGLTFALLRATPRIVSRTTIVEIGASGIAPYRDPNGVLLFAYQRNETVLRLCVKVR